MIRVLLIEDNPLDVRLFREMLNEIGGSAVELTHADRLTQAEAVLSRIDNDPDARNRQAPAPFHVILLDLSLPDSQGLDTVGRVKQAAAATPIIVLTGQGDEDLAMHTLAAGTQDYLVKGQVDGASLRRAIRYAIERKRAEWVERERLNLQEAVRAKNQVMGMVAHELRTPLTSLRMIAEYLLTDAAGDPMQTAQFLQSIHDEVVRMSELVNNLLESARLESGQARWRWSTVSLQRACDDAMDVVRPLCDQDRVNLTSAVDPPDLQFQGDGDAIRRLIINLVNNSIRHTSAGKINVTCNRMVRDGAAWIRIIVADTGQGIPGEILQRLGTAFALNSGVVGSGNITGAGLGLAICKGIAAAHGGRIAITSQPGKGTTVTVCLRADLLTPVVVTEDVQIIHEVAA